MFTRHVVCSRQHMTKRWATQDIANIVGISDFVGEVRTPTGNQRKRKWCRRAINVCREPRRNLVDINTLNIFALNSRGM